MAKQRFNFVGFHTYDSEPFVPFEWKGQLADAAPLASSLTYGWGAIRGLATKDFGFGTGEYFDRDPFASRSLLDGKGPAGPGAAEPDAVGRGAELCAGTWASKSASDLN